MLNRKNAQYERLRAEVTEMANQNGNIRINIDEPEQENIIYWPTHIIYDNSSPLSLELQEHPWPTNFKPKIPKYDDLSNPTRFLAN